MVGFKKISLDGFEGLFKHGTNEPKCGLLILSDFPEYSEEFLVNMVYHLNIEDFVIFYPDFTSLSNPDQIESSEEWLSSHSIPLLIDQVATSVYTLQELGCEEIVCISMGVGATLALSCASHQVNSIIKEFYFIILFVGVCSLATLRLSHLLLS